jgi:hypothetical protein
MRLDLIKKKISLRDLQGVKQTNALYTNAALRHLGDEYDKAFPLKRDTKTWLQSWSIEDLSNECPQEENDFDCGIFHLLNLCLLVMEGGISVESHSQASIAYLLWKASSNRPAV